MVSDLASGYALDKSATHPHSRQNHPPDVTKSFILSIRLLHTARSKLLRISKEAVDFSFSCFFSTVLYIYVKSRFFHTSFSIQDFLKISFSNLTELNFDKILRDVCHCVCHFEREKRIGWIQAI